MRRITATLTIQSRVEGVRDRYGNPTVEYSHRPWPVFALSPRQSEEPFEGTRSPVSTGLTVYAPADGPRPGPHDRVLYEGESWRVDGRVAVWDRNPHTLVTRHRGITVNLELSEG